MAAVEAEEVVITFSYFFSVFKFTTRELVQYNEVDLIGSENLQFVVLSLNLLKFNKSQFINIVALLFKLVLEY